MAVFDIVKMETRVTRMIGWLAGIQSKITDFLPGSKTRTKLEAIALELEQQDYQTYRAIQKAIPISIYRAFDFPPLAAVRASGLVTFSADPAPAQDIVIPRGTKVATTESSTAQAKTYETTAAATIPAGQTTVSVLASCTVPGTAGNTGAATINVQKTTIPGVTSVTNAAAITNGSAIESEDARAIRFQGYIQSLKRGTEEALAYGAGTVALLDVDGNITEKVSKAKVYNGTAATAGFADVFIYNGTGATSVDLIAEAQKIIDGYIDAAGAKVPGYAAAGIVATVASVTEIAQNVTVAVTKLSSAISATVQEKAEEAIATYIASLAIGEPIIFHELAERVMAVEGAYDIALTEPAANVPAQDITDPAFTGAGLDDMTTSGAYTGEGKKIYVVEVDATGAPDTYKWSKDGGATWEETGVVMVAATPQELEAGVSVAFAASTGHTLGDSWEFSATSACVFLSGAIAVAVS